MLEIKAESGLREDPVMLFGLEHPSKTWPCSMMAFSNGLRISFLFFIFCPVVVTTVDIWNVTDGD